jgi:hypothetical protein
MSCEVPAKSGFWRRCRICFRWLRITVWVIVLALLGVFLYVNQVGLPNFVKRPLLQKLRDRGIDLQFSRLRYRFYQGLVAENVRFGQTDEPGGPQITAEDVQVGLTFERRQLQVEGLKVRKGRLLWSLVESNAAPVQ